MKRNNIYNSNF